MALAGYFDLTAGKCFLAESTKPAVIERTPIPNLILRAQDLQSIIELQMEFHVGFSYSDNFTDKNVATIGRSTGRDVGKTLSASNHKTYGACARPRKWAANFRSGPPNALRDVRLAGCFPTLARLNCNWEYFANTSSGGSTQSIGRHPQGGDVRWGKCFAVRRYDTLRDRKKKFVRL